MCARRLCCKNYCAILVRVCSHRILNVWRIFCFMPKILTQKEFEKRVISIHGDKYDYSKVVYVNDNTNVVIVCKKCGIAFPQRPRHHLEGTGCPKCARERQINKGNKKTRTIKSNIGVVDFPENVAHLRSYHVWREIIRRCYDEKYRKRYQTYQDVKICKEWMSFSLFKKWFDENYIDGYVLDKDIISGKKNKIYSPETCCFVPPSLNSLLTRRNKLRGAYPIGVYRQKNGTFSASIRKYGKSVHLGIYKTIEEAFEAYKQAKETYIKEVAQSYFDKGEITERVYDALMKYEVEITD